MLNTIQRGEQESCGPPGIDSYASPSPTASHITLMQRRPTVAALPDPPASDETELSTLRRRVAELESERLRNQSSPAAERVPQRSSRIDALSEEEGDLSPRAIASRRNERHAASDEQAGQHNDSAVMKDAASILEFLAWGRRKDPSYPTVVSPEVTTTVSRGDIRDTGNQDEDPLGSLSECTDLQIIQLLLPSPRMVWQLLEYHENCLLWYHGSYYALTLNAEARTFYAKHSGVIESPGVDLQWVALLFAILSASLASAPPGQVQAWGFPDHERDTLAKRWFKASITCLNRAEYTANLSIYACQAIATSTVASHILGFSNSQSIHLAAAVRIAQSLGLHRLGRDVAGSATEKEIGRRVWCQLCSQDWFGIPFSDSYLVNCLYSTSEPPTNAHDGDLTPLPENVPTSTSYSRFLHKVAAIMPRLQDGIMSCNTLYTRYEQVLAWDARLRALATLERPVFLSHVPIEPEWPAWIPWARRALAISSGHKIIMIHRSVLSDSFTNPAFAFTRRTCLAASKTIIKEYKQVVEEDGPVLWIHQAFAVAASITLVLDILHRDPTEADCLEHKQLVQDVVDILKLYQYSAISKRGIKLLSALLVEVERRRAVPDRSGEPWDKRRRLNSGGTDARANDRQARRNTFSVPEFIRSFCEGQTGEDFTQPRTDGQAQGSNQGPDARIGNGGEGSGMHVSSDTVGNAFVDFNFSFPTFGLDASNGFDDLLYLANSNPLGMI